MKIKTSDIKRDGKIILLGQGYTAKEGYSGNIPMLTIHKDGKQIFEYSGSSLYFSDPLTEEDKEFLASLAEDAED